MSRLARNSRYPTDLCATLAFAFDPQHKKQDYLLDHHPNRTLGGVDVVCEIDETEYSR